MIKLDNETIKWIIKQSISGKRKNKELAEIYNITQRWVQILVKKYKETGTYKTMIKTRRPSTQLKNEQKEIINKSLEESQIKGAVLPRLYIMKHYNQTIPKNKLHI